MNLPVQGYAVYQQSVNPPKFQPLAGFSLRRLTLLSRARLPVPPRGHSDR